MSGLVGNSRRHVLSCRGSNQLYWIKRLSCHTCLIGITVWLCWDMDNYFVYKDKKCIYLRIWNVRSKSIPEVDVNIVWLCWCFYGPSTYFRSFQARSVNLPPLFLGKPPTPYATSFRRRFFAYHHAVKHPQTNIISSWFSIPLVLKCAPKCLKIGLQIKINAQKCFWIGIFAWRNY